MKVVVFQGGAVGGEPSREELLNLWHEELDGYSGIDEVVYRDKLELEKMDEQIGDADAALGIFMRDNVITEEFLQKHPKLKYACTFAHGYGKIDAEAVKRHNLTLTNTIYGDVTIAQYAMALLLDICHNVTLHDDYYKNKIWDTPEKTNGGRVLSRQIELYQKTIGIIGLGNIGLWMAKMAAGFGMKVISYSRHKKEGAEYNFIEQVSFEELLKRSDVISIHCPLTEETKNMIDKKAFDSMKDGVILINTARGAILDEDALYNALQTGKVYAAGLDVVTGEPLTKRCKLMDCRNTKITQHIAWAPAESRIRAVHIAAKNFKNYLEGHPTSVINL